jgi:hypothetical protein
MARRRLAPIALLALLAAPAPAPASASVRDAPVVPRIDGKLRARLLTVYRAGRTRGNRAAVFAKVGDSITESGSFLQDVGCGGALLGTHRGLAATIRYFSRVTFPAGYTSAYCGIANSFTRASLTAVTGWDAGSALARMADPPAACPPPLDRPLRCELHLLRPSVALIMYGTNDLERAGTAAFRTRLRRVVSETLAAGVIPVLSTIPPRHRAAGSVFAARVGRFNDTIAGLARSQRVPLWNYWRALSAPSLIDQGVSDDGVHPSVFRGEAGADFSAAGLRYGYNQRNLTALQVLAAVRRAVLDAR